MEMWESRKSNLHKDIGHNDCVRIWLPYLVYFIGFFIYFYSFFWRKNIATIVFAFK